MGEERLYKYLDADGGLMMLYNSTLMFTNATQLNDPFDCHPAYIHLSGEMPTPYKGWSSETVSWLEYNKRLQRRDITYICSLSKVHDSILMWSYYTKQHTGVCIGLNMEKTRAYLNRMNGLFLGCPELEVQYKDVINSHSTVKDSNDFLCYHFATKAKEWVHEQEVRLIAYDPSPEHMRLLPGQYEEDKSICSKFKKLFCTQKGMEKSMDWKEVRAFLEIGGECFESIYLGINMANKDKEKMIKVAKERNPNIKIYQMTIDPEAFKLKEQLID
ncbi:MAG: DUF2971 domain-containing protein [Bacteroidales bacterium]|nr:DUF2971 domain-containing protein [Bacteroidales bacterium]